MVVSTSSTTTQAQPLQVSDTMFGRFPCLFVNLFDYNPNIVSLIKPSDTMCTNQWWFRQAQPPHKLNYQKLACMMFGTFPRLFVNLFDYNPNIVSLVKPSDTMCTNQWWFRQAQPPHKLNHQKLAHIVPDTSVTVC